MAFPRFPVPGVPEDQEWQLFNVSNYQYYKQKVRGLIVGICPFCTIDPEVNKILYTNLHWVVWMNEMAPRSGQHNQLLFVSKRHIERISQMTIGEWNDLYDTLIWARENLGVSDDGVLLVRTGDPEYNAKSVPHLHFNFQYPTGKDRVEVTIAKSEEDLVGKIPVMQAWEKYRQAEEAGNPNPREALTDIEWSLIEKKMGPPPIGK